MLEVVVMMMLKLAVMMVVVVEMNTTGKTLNFIFSKVRFGIFPGKYHKDHHHHIY